MWKGAIEAAYKLQNIYQANLITFYCHFNKQQFTGSETSCRPH